MSKICERCGHECFGKWRDMRRRGWTMRLAAGNEIFTCGRCQEAEPAIPIEPEGIHYPFKRSSTMPRR